MKKTQVFFVTFIISFCIMLVSFIGLYWFMGYTSPKTAGTPKEGVPILTLEPDDAKTTLLVLKSGETEFYFLLKLNAIQNKVDLVSVPAGFELLKAQRTLTQSMEYAGIMQCVQDLSEEFDIAIDYHLVCDEQAMGQILSSFSGLDINGLDIPQSIRQYMLKGSEYIDVDAVMGAIKLSAPMLDNNLGLEFLNLAGYTLLKNNMHNLQEYALEDIKENFSLINTNIGTQELNKINRILSFLNNGEAEFGRLVLADRDTAQQDIDKQLKE